MRANLSKTMPLGPAQRVNTYNDSNIATYLTESRDMIMDWYPRAANVAHNNLVQNTFDFTTPTWTQELWECIRDDYSLIAICRALCYRHLGRAQFADFAGFGSQSKLKRIDDGVPVSFSDIECQRMAIVILRELSPTMAPWIPARRDPTPGEIHLAATIVFVRINDRKMGTDIRYQHEPRQRDKMRLFLNPQGFVEQHVTALTDPRNMQQGTYSFGVTLESKLDDGSIIMNPVDLLVMPNQQPTSNLLPIFMELKSMGDKLNPNKRHKEEGGKYRWLRNRWSTGHQDYFNYVLVVGGILPTRYLEHEQNQGIDWIYEDRASKLQSLLDWYNT
jgi:hypothetical protein